PLLMALGMVFTGAALAVLQLKWTALQAEDLEKLKIAGWSVPLIADYWLFGIGRGAFGSVFPAYAPPMGNKFYLYPENIAVQWVSEWGAPIALLAALAFVWAFRPRHVRIRGDSLGAAAATGIAMLLLQNLVDFGLERAATPLAATWALAVMWKRNNSEVESHAEGPAGLHGAAMLAAGFGLWVASLLFARQDLM